MIGGNIAKKQYDLRGRRFAVAFEFLRRDDLTRLPEGWIELEAGVRAGVQRYLTAPAQTLRFESHEDHIDIQYVVDGVESIGVVRRDALAVSTPYDPDADVTFYHDPELSGCILLHPGDYVILAPDDAHKPRCAAGEPSKVTKIVIKIPAD